MMKSLKSLRKRIEALECLQDPEVIQGQWCLYPAGVHPGPGERWVIDISVYEVDGRLKYHLMHARVTSDPQDGGRVNRWEDGEEKLLGTIEELRAEIDACPSREDLTRPGFIQPEPLGRSLHRDFTASTLPSQDRFLHSKAKYKGYSGPVGSGKTRGLCIEALRHVSQYNPGLNGLIGAPTYDMLRDVTLETMLDLLENHYPRIRYRYHQQRNILVFPQWGSKIFFRSLEHPERLRGRNLAWFAVDELTYCKKDAWLRLEGRLREPRANYLCGFAAWTPKGKDWVYKRFISANKLPNHAAILARPGENIFLPPDYYASLRQSYDDRLYQQEALGEYLNIYAGNAYHAFSEANVKPLRFDPRYPLWWTLDFNIHPACSLIGQFIDVPQSRADMLNGRRRQLVHVLQELSLPHTATPEHCDEFLRRIEPYLAQASPLHLYVYGDASGQGRQTTTGKSDWHFVQRFLMDLRHVKRYLHRPQSNPLVKDRVAAVNALFLNSAGERRCFVDVGCQLFIADLEEVVWKVDAAGNTLPQIDKNRDPMQTHLSDAFGYMAHAKFGIRPRVGESITARF